MFARMGCSQRSKPISKPSVLGAMTDVGERYVLAAAD
jgi:hypothetical protein